MNYSNEEILKGIQEKNMHTFKYLYKEYYRALVVYAINFVDQKEIAEDIVQDLFSNLWVINIDLQSVTSLKAFLYNSTKNRCINYLRHNSVKNRYAEYYLNDAPESSSMEEEMEEEEIYRQLFLAIESLPPRCKEIFELKLAGKKNEEIAALLSLSIETVKTQKKKAMRILKSKINALLLAEISTIILHSNQ